MSKINSNRQSFLLTITEEDSKPSDDTNLRGTIVSRAQFLNDIQQIDDSILLDMDAIKFKRDIILKRDKSYCITTFEEYFLIDGLN